MRGAGRPDALKARPLPRRYAILIGCLFCRMGLGMSYVFSTFLRPVVEELGWSRAVFASFGGPLLLSMSLASPLIDGNGLAIR